MVLLWNTCCCTLSSTLLRPPSHLTRRKVVSVADSLARARGSCIQPTSRAPTEPVSLPNQSQALNASSHVLARIRCKVAAPKTCRAPLSFHPRSHDYPSSPTMSHSSSRESPIHSIPLLNSPRVSLTAPRVFLHTQKTTSTGRITSTLRRAATVLLKLTVFTLPRPRPRPKVSMPSTLQRRV